MTNPIPSYSSFVPLQIFLTVLGIWLVFQNLELNGQRIDAQQSIAKLVPEAKVGLAAYQKLVELARDLTQTSASDAAAAQIVKEFKIQLHDPASSDGSNGDK